MLSHKDIILYGCGMTKRGWIWCILQDPYSSLLNIAVLVYLSLRANVSNKSQMHSFIALYYILLKSTHIIHIKIIYAADRILGIIQVLLEYFKIH